MKHKTCFAISGSCPDGTHILMLDIDTVKTKDVMMEIEEFMDGIIKEYGLSDVYVIKTMNGFNLFSLDKIPFNLIKQIGKQSKLCDKQFLDLGYKRGYYDLRTGRDKSFLYKIQGSLKKRYMKSNMHRLSFNLAFDMIIKKDELFDNSTQLPIVQYESDKHGYYEMEE